MGRWASRALNPLVQLDGWVWGSTQAELEVLQGRPPAPAATGGRLVGARPESSCEWMMRCAPPPPPPSCQQGYAWIPVHDSQLLDYERCEFLLVGTAAEPAAELGKLGAAGPQRQDSSASCRR